MNVENINEKTRPRAKKSFHYSSIKDKKYKNRFFNTNKNSESLSAIKIKRNSQITRKIDNKNKNDLFSLSKSNKVYSMKEYDYLMPYKKTAYNLLKRKYNCSYIVYTNIKLNKKTEVRSVYDSNLIQNLLENKKTKLYCKIKEDLIYTNLTENFYHNYTQIEAKNFLKYLLFCIYDKDRMTYNKNLSEKNDKDKLKLLSEKIIRKLYDAYISTMNNNINKTKKKEESKESNKQNKHKKHQSHKYPFIFDLSPFDVHNSIPNLFPSGENVMYYLKAYLKKKLSQKLYQNKFYCKNVSDGMDSTIRFNKSTKDNKNSKSKTVNISFSKIVFRKKNNTININHDNIRRIQNDIDTCDVEKLIKIIMKRGQKSKKKDLIKSQKIKVKFHFNSSNNKVDKSYEKNQISQNSTTLSAINREGNLSYRTNLINNSPLNYVTRLKNFVRSKLFFNRLNLKKYNINNSEIKLNQNSFQNNVDNSFPINNFDKNDDQYNFKYNHFRKILTLKEFFKLSKNKNSNFIEDKMKLYKPKKAVEYQNDIYIFTKNINRNVWEKGEDIICQRKANDFKEKVLNKLKLLQSKRLNRHNKCYTFRKLVKYGDIYYKDI